MDNSSSHGIVTEGPGFNFFAVRDGAVASRVQSVYWSEREAGWHGVRVADILAG